MTATAASAPAPIISRAGLGSGRSRPGPRGGRLCPDESAAVVRLISRPHARRPRARALCAPWQPPAVLLAVLLRLLSPLTAVLGFLALILALYRPDLRVAARLRAIARCLRALGHDHRLGLGCRLDIDDFWFGRLDHRVDSRIVVVFTRIGSIDRAEAGGTKADSQDACSRQAADRDGKTLSHRVGTPIACLYAYPEEPLAEKVPSISRSDGTLLSDSPSGR